MIILCYECTFPVFLTFTFFPVLWHCHAPLPLYSAYSWFLITAHFNILLWENTIWNNTILPRILKNYVNHWTRKAATFFYFNLILLMHITGGCAYLRNDRLNQDQEILVCNWRIQFPSQIMKEREVDNTWSSHWSRLKKGDGKKKKEGMEKERKLKREFSGRVKLIYYSML